MRLDLEIRRATPATSPHPDVEGARRIQVDDVDARRQLVLSDGYGWTFQGGTLVVARATLARERAELEALAASRRSRLAQPVPKGATRERARRRALDRILAEPAPVDRLP